VTASAGNHAQGVALAATRSGVDSKIVMPEHAPISKVKATKSYGAEVVLGRDYNEAAERAHELERARRTGPTSTRSTTNTSWPGQGDDRPRDPRGLPRCRDGRRSDRRRRSHQRYRGRDQGATARRSRDRGAGQRRLERRRVPRKGERVSIDEVDTIADGIATRSIGEQTFPHIFGSTSTRSSLSPIPRSPSRWSTCSSVRRPSSRALARSRSRRCCSRSSTTPRTKSSSPALCGGNIDLNTLANVIVRGLVETGRYLKIKTVLKDRPGALDDLLDIFTEQRVNIYAIHHDHTSRNVEMSDTEVELELEMRGPDHVDEVPVRASGRGGVRGRRARLTGITAGSPCFYKAD